MSLLSSLPEEIQVEVLVRLPVKSILICKCVCKVWCSLISSSIFVKSHLNQSIQTNNTRLMFIDHEHEEGHKAKLSMYSVDYYSVASSSSEPICNTGVATRMDYPFPLKCKGRSDRFVHFFGSCDGLLCLGITNYDIVNGKDDNMFIIWNPTIRECKQVRPQEDHCFALGRYGFGYDCTLDDYKLVKIIMKGSGCTEFLVYSLRSESWKTIETNLDYSWINFHGVLFNGFLHWLFVAKSTTSTQSTSSDAIIAFNIGNERLIHVPLPKEASPLDPKVSKTVGLWESCLCLVDTNVGIRTDVWVMQNYGVRESWNKKISISHLAITKCYYPRLVLSLADGEILIQVPGGFVLFNPRNETVRKVHLHDISEYAVYVKIYVESLVSPKENSGTKAK